MSDELLNTEHSHYRDQINRIRNALEQDSDLKSYQSQIADAKRSIQWIFEEPVAAAEEESRLESRISKEFLDLNLPVLIHPSPPHRVVTEKTTVFSSLTLDFSTGQIVVFVAVPYFQDSGIRRAKNESVFLTLILLRRGIMELPLDEKDTLSLSMRGEPQKPGGLIARYMQTVGLSPDHLSLSIKKLAAGGGIAITACTVPFPLHIGGNLRESIERTSYRPFSPAPGASTGTLPTGLIIDASAFSLKPFRDPVLVSEHRERLFVPDAGRPSSAMPYGWAGWVDSLEDPETLLQRVGPRPLRIVPEAVVDNNVFIVKEQEADRLSRFFSGTKLLSSGHIIILISPGPSPLPAKAVSR